jgi:hypothetical protein
MNAQQQGPARGPGSGSESGRVESWWGLKDILGVIYGPYSFVIQHNKERLGHIFQSSDKLCIKKDKTTHRNLGYHTGLYD